MDIEALAIAPAIDLEAELGITHAVLEGDLGMIVKALAVEVFLTGFPCPFDTRCEDIISFFFSISLLLH